MEFGWNEELEAFRDEVRAFLREFDTTRPPRGACQPRRECPAGP